MTNEKISVEIGQFRPVEDKGTWKATFSLLIYPMGQKILDCKYFIKDDQRWFSFPSKTIKKNDDKPDYIPLVSYLNKEYLEQLKEAVLEALKTAKPMERNDKSKTSEGRATPIQGDASGLWF